MKITLPPELRAYVEEKIRDGQYARPDDMVRDALMAMRAQERWTPADRAELRRELLLAVRQMERGETSDWTAADIKKAGRKLLARRKVVVSSKSTAHRRAS
jgi:putative addiction module CopG family antidote